MMKNRFKSFVAVAIGLMLGAISMAASADPVFTRFESKTMVAAQDEPKGFHGESVAVLAKSSETARLCSATASEKADSTFTFESVSPTIFGHTLAAPAPFDPGKGYAQT